MDRDKPPVTPAMLAATFQGRDIEAGTPAGILASEKMGQIELTRTASRLPLELRPAKEAWEKIGFTFGETVDQLFQNATFPAGWVIRPTDHSMHSEILDDKGRVRGGVFYKAAFYDRRANAHLKQRYTVEPRYSDLAGGENLPADTQQIVVADAGVAMKTFGDPVPQRDWEAAEPHRKAAIEWLEANYPENDPTAYWDQP